MRPLRLRITHASLVGAGAGMLAFFEAHHLDTSWAALAFGALVAGFSGAAGTWLRSHVSFDAGADKSEQILARLTKLESEVYELKDLVTVFLAKGAR